MGIFESDLENDINSLVDQFNRGVTKKVLRVSLGL